MKTRRPARVALLVLLATACGSGGSATDPGDRAAVVEAGGCEFTSPRTGSGVVVGDGRVLTVAHLVARADRVMVRTVGGEPQPAEVASYDPGLDLALLRVRDTSGVRDVGFSGASAGAPGRIVGGAASGDVAFTVIRPVSLSIEEVLGTERHSRVGYEIDAETATGDSGAGAYDADGRLVGIVFAITETGGSSWLTAASEIKQFLAAKPAGQPPGCG